MAYQCGNVIVELIPDDGIEREGKICSGYYGHVYESERAVENDDYIDDFCIALGHELTADNTRGIREALAHYFDLPIIRIREMEEERQENKDMNDRNFVKFIKEQYPPGTRIRLNSMDDPCLPSAPGTEGEVDFVDDIGQLHMKWDNGRTLALVPGEDSFSILPPKLTTLKLYMPLTADLFEPNEYGDMDECSELLEGHELRGYQDQIMAALVKNRMPEEAERGLMHWYGKADNIDKKVHSAVFTVENRKQKLWGVAECRVAGELSPDELSVLKEYIAGQASDGWGEGFEQREIRLGHGCDLCVHFWNSDEWSIQTEQELFALKLDENQYDAPQIGGMTLG